MPAQNPRPQQAGRAHPDYAAIAGRVTGAVFGPMIAVAAGVLGTLGVALVWPQLGKARRPDETVV